ncbi:hypothetical protein ACTAB0_14185 [Pseudomonas syringae]|uniref:hypothetical protein n=1 Tax=Pseudomonas syringae TaxID=317 RepID=UPI003F791C44
MINRSNKLIYLKDQEFVLKSTKDLIQKTTDLVPQLFAGGRKKHPFLAYISGMILRSSDIDIFLSLILGACLSGKAADSNARKLFEFLGYKFPGQNAINSLLPALKYLLAGLHKARILTLPYEFSRPLSTWIGELKDSDSCYSEVILAFRSLDTEKWPDPSKGGSYSAEEKTNRRLFTTATKVAFASGWVAPEDITAADILAWRDIKVVESRDGGTHQTTPIPMNDLLDFLQSTFGERLRFNVSKVRLEINTTIRVAPHSVVEYLPRIFEDTTSPLAVIDELLASPLRGMASFSNKDISEYDIVRALLSIGIDISKSYSCWLEAQKLFMRFQQYTNEKSWGTLFGRFNMYVFIYLPLWFNSNPESNIEYPDTPSKFEGALFYEGLQGPSPDRPLTLVQFYEYAGFTYSATVARNARTFFDHLVKMHTLIGDEKPVKQPVHRTPRETGRDKTVKHALSRPLENLFHKYLLAKQSQADFINENVDVVWAEIRKKVRSVGRRVFEIDLRELGSVAEVSHENHSYPVSKFHVESLLFTSYKDQIYFNPATYVFPFCLLRGGFRGQNLQWLDADTYDRMSEPSNRHARELDWCWVNTDKIQKKAFCAYVRPSVMNMLDIQRDWRDRLLKLGCDAFSKRVDYEGKKGTRWGQIKCLFANNVRSGAPVSDKVYTSLWVYTLLDFQNWLKFNGLAAETFVAYMPVKTGSNSRRISFNWNDWEKKDFPLDSVKIDTKDYPDGAVPFCPVNLRAKITPHSGRVTHITLLREHADAASVCLTTGQSADMTDYYDRGEVSLIRKLEGVLNKNDSGWQLTGPTLPSAQAKNISDKILQAQVHGSVQNLIDDFSLLSLPHPDPARSGEEGIHIIAREKSSSLGVANTHLCSLNMNCSADVISILGGKFRCSWCPYAIFSTDLIFEVSAKRHYLAEELYRVTRQLDNYRTTKRVAAAEIEMLSQTTKTMAEDVLGWYVVEKTLDMFIRSKQKGLSSANYLVSDREKALMEIKNHVVRTDSVEAFMYRFEQVCDNPLTMSEDFRDKINRGVRYLLAQSGDVTAAVMYASSVSPEMKLAALMRERASFGGIEIESLVKFINMPQEEWSTAVLSQRSEDECNSDFVKELLGYE